MKYRPRRMHVEEMEPRLCLTFGDVDMNFANDGRFEDSFPVVNRTEYVAAIVALEDSQLLVESIGSGSGSAIGFSKIDEAGQLESDFGVGGMHEWFDRDHAEAIASVLRISNGNIVVETGQLNNRSFVAFDSEGIVDESFGDQGLLRLGGGLSYDSIAHPDGGFLTLGRDNQETVLRRFTNAGKLDVSFGNDGEIRLPVVLQPQFLVAPDGRVLLFGSRQESGTSMSVIVRLHADGSADETFGEDGVRAVEAPLLERMYMSPLGDSYFTVFATNGTDSREYTVSKYTIAMELDKSFGDEGVFHFEVAKGRYELNMFVHPTADGELFIEQTWVENRGSRMVIANISADGSMNHSFGVSGLAQFALDQSVFSRGLHRDADGNLYWLGTHEPEPGNNWKHDGLVVRFTPQGEVDQSWGDSGRRGTDRTTGVSKTDAIELARTHRGSPLIAAGWQGFGSPLVHTGRVHVGAPTGTIQTSTLGDTKVLSPVTIGASDGGWYVINGAGANPYSIEIRKFSEDSTPDISFGTDGHIVVSTPRANELFARVDDEGTVTIVASNHRKTAEVSEGIGVAAIIRITADGELDPRFADGGVLRLYEKPSAVLDVMVSTSLGVVLVYRDSVFHAFDANGQAVSGFGENGLAAPEELERHVWVTGEIDERGNLYGIVRLYYSDFTQGYLLVKVDPQGRLDSSFSSGGKLDLPWEWNVAHDAPEIAVRSGVILLANAHGRHSAEVRLLAYDYSGEALDALGDSGVRDYDFSPNGETVTGLEFADDGSVWLSLIERRGFNEMGAVYRLFGHTKSQMHNWYDRLDVNRDHSVSPSDVLMIVNQLNSGISNPRSRPDVNNDDVVTPIDALIIINRLNQSPGAEAEGEASSRENHVDLSWLFDDDDDDEYQLWGGGV